MPCRVVRLEVPRKLDEIGDDHCFFCARERRKVLFRAAADAGYKVHLVEKEKTLGGYLSKLHRSVPTLPPYKDLEPLDKHAAGIDAGGPQMIDEAIRNVIEADYPEMVYGEDYVNLGFKSGGEGGGIYKTLDGGDTWQVVFDGTTVAGSSDVNLIAFSPNFAADGEAYAWLEGGGLLHSTDGGRSWTLVDSESDRPSPRTPICDERG